jgi:hypothetical protein
MITGGKISLLWVKLGYEWTIETTSLVDSRPQIRGDLLLICCIKYTVGRNVCSVHPIAHLLIKDKCFYLCSLFLIMSFIFVHKLLFFSNLYVFMKMLI